MPREMYDRFCDDIRHITSFCRLASRMIDNDDLSASVLKACCRAEADLFRIKAAMAKKQPNSWAKEG